MLHLAWSGLGLVLLAGCSDSAVPTSTAPEREAVAASARFDPVEVAATDVTLVTAAPVEPTFPGLAAIPGGPAPRIADFDITLERTWCLGTCPIYKVHVRGDGSVTYEGKKYVLLAERVETRLDPAVLEPILRELEAIDFLRHEHRCGSEMRDAPGTVVSLRVGDRTRTVVDDHMGRDCGFREPSADPTWHAAVDRIGRLIDSTVGIESWIGSAEERSRFQRDR